MQTIMDLKVIAISDYSTDDMPRRATLESATDSTRKFNAFLFPHAQGDKANNIVSAVSATEDFKYTMQTNLLLQEVDNAPLSQWEIGTCVEYYI